MDARRQQQQQQAHASMQSQQFPPLLHPQGSGHPPPRLPVPLPHPHLGFGPRPNSFSGPGYPMAGQKRSNRYSDGGGATKLFVASLPRNITEDEVRGLFDEFGNVLEVMFLKDKKTGLPQGCCFIKYGSFTEAERAVQALDNQRALPGGPAPLQVKFADGERDHPGPMEHKLFVGSISKQATEQEIEEIFAPYGRVENVYLIRDEQKRSKGCAFVSFPERDMAIAAISALNGVFRMPGCHQPIIVRFADPKRPRSEERERNRPGPNYSPRSHYGSSGPNYPGGPNYQGPGGARASGGLAMDAHGPPFGWRQGGGASGMGLIPQGGMGAPASRRDPMEGSINPMGVRGSSGPSLEKSSAVPGQVPILGMAPQLSQQQGFKESPLHKPAQAFGQQPPSHQQRFQHGLPTGTPQLNQVPPMQGFPLTDARSQPHIPLGQYSSGQPTAQMYGHTSAASHQLQHQIVGSVQQRGAAPQQVPFQPLHLHDQDSQQKQPPLVMPTPQPLQQLHQALLPSQPQAINVKEMSQQAPLQPSLMTNQENQQQPAALQPSWNAPLLQQPGHSVAAPSVATTSATPVSATPAQATCAWTEHVSPEGHKYYYNGSTGESRWEKPEEFANYEQQLQQQQQQQFVQPQPQLQQQQFVAAQAQAQAHPQYSNLQYLQQQALLGHQPLQQAQQVPHHYQHQNQPLLQQAQQAQLQHQQQPQFQQIQPLSQYSSPGMLISQVPSGGSYQQAAQGYYAQVQPTNGVVDASKGSQLQQFTPNQQIPVSNGASDTVGSQWMPAMQQQQQQQQQALPNLDWTWKSKPV